jgi:hypothetical protein
VDIRRALRRQEPSRLDTAEELGVALYLFMRVRPDATAAVRSELLALLAPLSALWAWSVASGIGAGQGRASRWRASPVAFWCWVLCLS